MSSKHTAVFLVAMDVPEGADPADMLLYVQRVVAGGRHQFSIDDPLFYLDPTSVTVTLHSRLQKTGPKL